jgi:hypothetical protein
VYAGLPSVAGEIANRTRWLRGPAVYPAAALRDVLVMTQAPRLAFLRVLLKIRSGTHIGLPRA